MQYLVKRGEEQFGPYSLAELQEYARDGRILPTDLAKSEGIADWVPVSQILGNIPVPAVAAPVTIAPPVQTVPLPPNLHWALLLILFLIGNFLPLIGGLFGWIWALVIANWARRLNGSNVPLILTAIYPVSLFSAGIAIGVSRLKDAPFLSFIALVLGLAGFIGFIYAIFKIRDAMEEYYNSKENIALTLSGVMTFFFNYVYFQYHINRIANWKKTGVLS